MARDAYCVDSSSLQGIVGESDFLVVRIAGKMPWKKGISIWNFGWRV